MSKNPQRPTTRDFIDSARFPRDRIRYLGGGQGFINTVTRSGTNALHGEAFYYNRNSAFQANDAISKASGLPKPLDDLQQFGGTVGGPILRDRLWFFAD